MMCQLDRLRSLRGEIYEIARKHKADKVYVFGSCARGEETPTATSTFWSSFKKAFRSAICSDFRTVSKSS